MHIVRNTFWYNLQWVIDQRPGADAGFFPGGGQNSTHVKKTNMVLGEFAHGKFVWPF